MQQLTSPRVRLPARSRLAVRAHAGAKADSSSPSSAPSKCPFAQLPSFMLNEPRPPKLSPLGEAVVFAPEPSPPMSAHLWLEAGVSGQDVPGRLTSGLRPLRYVEEWMPQDMANHASELAMKKRGLDERRSLCFQAEERSLAGQRETLELFMDYLPKRHPEVYSVSGEGAAQSITVATTGETFRLADWAHAPLELCNRLVQEDLVLMRAADEPTSEPDGGFRHAMSAASVVFSFGDLDKKLSSPMTFIHAPVPGFATELNKLLNKTLDSLQPGMPVWRNNWLVVESGLIDQPSFGTPEALEARKKLMPPQERFLKVEYQTLRRLPASKNILFTVRTLLEPLPCVKEVPGAAECLSRSMRDMSPALLAYKGVTAEGREPMLAYLDAITAQEVAAR